MNVLANLSSAFCGLCKTNTVVELLVCRSAVCFCSTVFGNKRSDPICLFSCGPRPTGVCFLSPQYTRWMSQYTRWCVNPTYDHVHVKLPLCCSSSFSPLLVLLQSLLPVPPCLNSRLPAVSEVVAFRSKILFRWCHFRKLHFQGFAWNRRSARTFEIHFWFCIHTFPSYIIVVYMPYVVPPGLRENYRT